MRLGSLNRAFWLAYEAGTTPGPDIVPSDAVLSELSSGDTVLDVGTGTGKLAEWFADRGFDVSAIDINSKEIERSRTRSTRVQYSTQDIASGTDLPDGFFHLLAFRCVLVNLHREQEAPLQREILRLLRPDGMAWVAEALVSESYRERYELSAPLLAESHAFHVFKDPELAKQVRTTQQLQEAIDAGKIARIVRHYTKQELCDLFVGFRAQLWEEVEILSPSGYPIRMANALFKRIG